MSQDIFLCYVTFPSQDLAIKIGRDLVRSGVAAGVNIFGQGVSIFHWAGELRETEEWYMLAQVSAEKFEDFKSAIITSHPYAVPCVMGWPAPRGHDSFLSWVRSMEEAHDANSPDFP